MLKHLTLYCSFSAVELPLFSLVLLLKRHLHTGQTNTKHVDLGGGGRGVNAETRL